MRCTSQLTFRNSWDYVILACSIEYEIADQSLAELIPSTSLNCQNFIIFLIKHFPQSIYAVRVDSPYVFFRYRHRQRDRFASILLIKFENECFNVYGKIREIEKSIQSNIFLKIIACIRKYYREIYPLLFFQYHSETIHI